MKPNIFVTGFSGSGKTTVGREVAARLGWRFVDLDDEIVSAAGQPIDAIFSKKGESHFRRLESECLARVCKGERQVVSTGGGIVMDERNRRLMGGRGAVICLEARPGTIYERLQKQGQESAGAGVRPMLVASRLACPDTLLEKGASIRLYSCPLDGAHGRIDALAGGPRSSEGLEHHQRAKRNQDPVGR